MATASIPVDGSPEDFSHADSYVQSEQGDATYCDDIPDLTDEVSQAESLPLSEQETVIVTEETTESHDDSLPLSEATDTDPQQSVKSSIGQSELSNSDQRNGTTKHKPVLPKKPEVCFTNSEPIGSFANGSIPKKRELTVSELYSESDTSEICQLDRKKLANGSAGLNLKRSDSKSKKANSSNKKEPQKDNNQNITYMQYNENVSSMMRNQSQDSLSSDKQLDSYSSKDKSEVSADQPSGKGKRNRRKQVMLV